MTTIVGGRVVYQRPTGDSERLSIHAADRPPRSHDRLQRPAALGSRLRADRAGRSHRPPGPQRRRQDDAHAAARRRRAARPRPRRTVARHARRPAAAGRAAGDRRHGQRRRRRPASTPQACTARRSGRKPGASTGCSPTCSSTPRRDFAPPLHRHEAPRAAGPGAGRAIPTCCCSTSRPTTSTSRPSSGSKASWPRGSRRCCSSRTTAQFLTNLARRILEIDRGKLFDWACDYPTFLARKEEALAAEEKQNALFDKKLAQEEAWIRQGIKARRTRNEGRVRALEELRRVAPSSAATTSATCSWQIDEGERSGALVLKAEDAAFGYGGDRSFAA